MEALPTTDGVDRYRQQEGKGTLYVVSGSAGQLGPGTFDHPSMARSLELHGSLVLDVDACSLEGRFLTDASAVRDAFALDTPERCTR